MGTRTKRWLIGGWLALVLGGWFLADTMDDGITPTGGPQPSPTASPTPSALPDTSGGGGCPPEPSPSPSTETSDEVTVTLCVTDRATTSDD
ncbi:hypothetical protein ABCR94_26210 [Streptomyces sp. 21So2-11]|uniref:hypothetical protein n=1 Tax=Streptomyces sp. 21So2-11 TaxID=3144408 RepID=UPI0032199EFD